MSGALDQLLLEDKSTNKIAKFCPEKFLGYHKCMMENKTEPGKCAGVQSELSACIKSEVPSFQRIQKDCLNHLKGYELCLKNNFKDSPATKCFEKLQELRECAGSATGISK